MAELRLPLLGVSDRNTARRQGWKTCPPGSAQNVVSRRSEAGTLQITKRPALRKILTQRLGTGPVQGLASIAAASRATTFAIGDTTVLTDLNGIGRLSIEYDANAWLMPLQMGQSRGLRDTLKLYGSAGACLIRSGGSADASTIAGIATFPDSPTPWATPVHPSGLLTAVLVNYTDTTEKTLIAFQDAATGALVAVKNLMGADVEASACVWTDRALWIAKGATLHYIPTPVTDGIIAVDDPASLTVLQAAGSLAGDLSAVDTIVGMCTYQEGGTGGDVIIYAVFEGETSTGLTDNPPGAITTGGYARHFRSGLHRLQEVEAADGSLDYDVLPFGTVPSLTDQYVEVDAGVPVAHRSLRFSQILDRAPRGCLPLSVACNDSGFVAVTFTNQGYGPNVSFLPDGSRPYTTVVKFDATGEWLWEADPSSNVSGEAGGKLTSVSGTFATDIPDEDGGNAGTTSKNGPAVRYCAMDSFGDVYAAGRLGNGPSCAWAFQSGSGNAKWTPRNLIDASQLPGAAGFQATGLALADGSVFVTATRSTLWDPDQATDTEGYALLWRLDPIDAALEWSYDFTQQAPGTPPNDSPAPVCLSAAAGVLMMGSAIFTDS
jgi:hypothetical protein